MNFCPLKKEKLTEPCGHPATVQTVSRLNSSLHMRQSKQLLRHVGVWTAVQTATRLNSTENVMHEQLLFFQNLASGHKTKHFNIQLFLHSTRGLGGIEKLMK